MGDFITAKGARSLVNEYKEKTYLDSLTFISNNIINACKQGKTHVDVDLTIESSVLSRIINFLRDDCQYRIGSRSNDLNNNYTIHINWKEE